MIPCRHGVRWMYLFSFSGGEGYPAPSNTCFTPATQSTAGLFLSFPKLLCLQTQEHMPLGRVGSRALSLEGLDRTWPALLVAAPRWALLCWHGVGRAVKVRPATISLRMDRASWVMPGELCAGQAEEDMGSVEGWDPENCLFVSAPGSMKHLSLPPDVRCVYSC